VVLAMLDSMAAMAAQVTQTAVGGNAGGTATRKEIIHPLQLRNTSPRS